MRACTKGRVFDSRRAALASDLLRSLDAFKCRECGGWHVRPRRWKPTPNQPPEGAA